jgi:hypothetical protein
MILSVVQLHLIITDIEPSRSRWRRWSSCHREVIGYDKSSRKEFVGFASVAMGKATVTFTDLAIFLLLAQWMKKFRFAFIFIEVFSIK